MVRSGQQLHQEIARISKESSEEDFAEVAEQLNGLSVSEVTYLLGRLNKRRRAIVYRLLDKGLALKVFESLSPASQSDLLNALQEHDTAEIFLGLNPDDRVWLLDELPATVATKLMQGLDVEERDETAALLGYPEDAIGRRMSPRFIQLYPWLTVAEAMQRVRNDLGSAESIYYLPVVDDGRKVIGEVRLRHLMSHDDETTIEALMRPTHTAEATEDAEEVARRTARRGAFAVSIVDHEHRLVGIFTLDDAVRILEYEESEDVSRQGGVEPIRRPYLATPVMRLFRSRIVWLLVLAVGATLTVQVLEIFEDALAQVTVLALFVPLLIGTGGNTGNQAATTVTRAIALDHLQPRDIFRVLTREVRTGFLLGLTLGMLGFGITGFFYDFDVGLVIGLTLLAVCTVAASIGGIMPLIAKLVKVDPAVFSNPFITTFVDATGLVIYFLIAQAVLPEIS
ncbi:magnesium transporter [Enteractinococcus coprophilus]|uniref:Magnesium transporter MgtE n=1 Tax=Enteractinococcus coprophilus TaxID=1027633 RepID=A0A543AGK6_9MICC|nr:magnesium transporter [Enteractinococcus coprophilus]TQL71721.1 magnesium transporter [Enteractinococcus coprophilus]